MTTDKTLPVVAWRRPSIYSECLPVFTPLCSEAAEWDEGGHEVAALADHAEASARIAELEAQVRELRANAERLDFIEREWFYKNAAGLISFGFNETWDAGQHANLRAAIDAAIAEEKGQ